MKNILIALLLMIGCSNAMAQVVVIDPQNPSLLRQKWEGNITFYDKSGKALLSYKMDTSVQRLSATEAVETYVEHLPNGPVHSRCLVSVKYLGNQQKELSYSCAYRDDAFKISQKCDGDICTGAFDGHPMVSLRQLNKRTNTVTANGDFGPSGAHVMREVSILKYAY